MTNDEPHLTIFVSSMIGPLWSEIEEQSDE